VQNRAILKEGGKLQVTSSNYIRTRHCQALNRALTPFDKFFSTSAKTDLHFCTDS